MLNITKMMTSKLVIFDLDGTLLNTISDLGTACNHALSQLGLPQHPLEAYNKMVGNGLRKLVERSAPEVPPETIDRLIALTKEYYNGHCTDTTLPYPGMPELLDELVSRGVMVAVASNKYQEGTDRIIRHFFPRVPFIAIEGQNDERPIKPDPTILLDIIKTGEETIGEPLRGSEVRMVGDSTVDIETARRAGIESIAVSWGFSPIEEIETARPDHVVTQASQILQYL